MAHLYRLEIRLLPSIQHLGDLEYHLLPKADGVHRAAPPLFHKSSLVCELGIRVPPNVVALAVDLVCRVLGGDHCVRGTFFQGVKPTANGEHGGKDFIDMEDQLH
eukprot:2807650-Prymnesium_polylepis.1